MAVTVRRLLTQPLGLRLLAGEAGLDRPLSWVTVSELEDPTPYLEGGELVLLTGVGFAVDGPLAGRYVERLVGRQVAALGFGIGVRHESVPAALLEAARDAELPLLEVDRPTPFVAVSRAVAGLLGAQAQERSARRLEGMRALTADVARGADSTVAVRRLAALAGGHVVVFGARGEVLVQSSGAEVSAAAAVVDRIRGRGTKVSASVAGAGGRVVAVPLGVGARATGYLAVCGPGDREVDQHLVAFAAALLTLDRERSSGVAETTRWARAVALLQALELAPPVLRAGPLRAPAVVLGPLADPARAVRVVAVRGVSADAVLTAISTLDDEDRVLAVDLPPDSVPGFARLLAEGVCAVVVADDELDAVLSPDLRGAVSGPVAAAEVAQVLPAVLSLAERSGGGLLRAEDAPLTLHDVLGERAVAAFARGVLEPLDGLDGVERVALTQTLRVWLSTNGEVGSAAGQLGVHRHTLRQRLRRAAQVLGRDLDNPQTRVDLWVALGSQ